MGTRCCVVVRCDDPLLFGLLKSGIPNLIWRTNRSSGSWVVTLNVPKELQIRLPSRTGKPTKRLQQSTGTDSLALARKRFPRIMADLQRRLLEASAANSESPDERMRRELGVLYVRTADNPDGVAASKQKAARWLDQAFDDLARVNASPQELDRYLTGVLGDMKMLLQLMTQKHASQIGLAVEDEKLFSYATGVKKAIFEGTENAEQSIESGLLHRESDLGKSLRADAGKPSQTNLLQALELKRPDLGERTILNYETQIAAWEEHIGDLNLSSVRSSSLNSFIRWLSSPVESGGRGMGKDSANNYGLKIRSLLKIHNQHCQDDQHRIAFPDFDLLQHSETEKRRRVLRDRERAATDETCMKMHEAVVDLYPDLLALIPLYRLAGLRNTEAPFLQWKHVYQDRSGIWVIDLSWSKTAKGIRLIPVNKKLQEILLPLRGDSEAFVLPERIHDVDNTRGWIGSRLRRARQLAGVKQSANAHSYRHAFGGDLSYHCTQEVKQKLMGHKGNLTAHYTSEKMSELAKAVEFVGSEIKFRSSC